MPYFDKEEMVFTPEAKEMLNISVSDLLNKKTDLSDKELQELENDNFQELVKNVGQ